MNKHPRINPEFKDLIPPLTLQEYHQLEQNILAHGCRDPIVLWKDLIIDGHNRYDICTRYSIDFATIKLRLPSKDAAKLWMLTNQLGRRNLSDAMRIELAARKLEIKGQTEHINKHIAKEAKLSERTIYRYMQIKTKGDPELLAMVMSGEMKIGTAHRRCAEVITTTIEDMGKDTIPEQRKRQYRINAIMGNIRQIEAFYLFLGRHLMYCRGVEVITKLDAQLRRVKRIVGSVID